MRNLRLLALAAIASTALSLPVLATDYPALVVDALGREVTLEQEPARIALMDARDIFAVALLDRINPFERVVAWTDNMIKSDTGTTELLFESFDGARDIPVIGGRDNPDVEKLIASMPDLVIAQASMKEKFDEIGLEAKMDEIGAEIIYLEVKRNPVTDTTKGVVALAHALNREEQAGEYVAFHDSHFEAIREKLATIAERPKVFVEVKAGNEGDGCCFTHGENGWGLLIEAVGGDNIGSTLLPGPYGDVSLETLILQEQPDTYIMTGSQWTNEGNKAAPFGYGVTLEEVQRSLVTLADRPGLEVVPAIEDHQVYGIYHQFYDHTYNIVALEYLAKFIHPDLFSDLNPMDTYNQLLSELTAIPQAPGIFGAAAYPNN